MTLTPPTLPLDQPWFEAFVAAGPFAMLLVDEAGRFRFANRAAERLLGYGPGELLGLSAEAVLPWSHLVPSAASETPGDLTGAGLPRGARVCDARRKDGSGVPVQVELSAVAKVEGPITLAAMVDVSDRVTHERSFRQLAESVPHMIWTCLADGTCDYLSPQWVAYTGIPEAEQLGFRWLEQLHPDDVDPTRESWSAAARLAADGALDARFATEFRIRRHDGEYRWFQTRAEPVRSGAGAVLKWYGTNTDVQDHRDARDDIARLNRELEERVRSRTEDLHVANEKAETTAKQLAAAQRITQVGSWQLDIATGDVTWSTELFHIFGLPEETDPPNYTRQAGLFTPESWARLTASIARAVDTGEGYQLTLTALHTSGEQLTTVALAEALRDGAGRVTRLVGTFQDTTEQERTAALLRRLTERFQLATSAAKLGVWDWTLADNLLVWDATMHRLYDIPEGTFRGAYDHWRACVHPDDLPRVERALEEAKAGTADFSTVFRVRTRSGVKHLGAMASVNRDSDGNVTRIVGVNWDVTELRLAERALVESQALQSALLSHAGSAIIGTDPEGTITLFNHAAEELLGYAADEVVGIATPALIHEASEVAARREALEAELGAALPDPFGVLVAQARRGVTQAREWTYVRKDGAHIPVLLTISAVKSEGGDIVGFLGVAIDLTQRLALENELRDLNRKLEDRSAQKEVLLQEVHHRVKNNLQVIGSLINMQVRKANPAARAALEECQSRVRSIALIHETLYTSKDYARVPFSDYARGLAEGVLAASRLSAGPKLELQLGPLLLPVDKAIPCGLILNELIINAVKHGFPGDRAGTIRVVIEQLPSGEVSMSVANDGVALRPDFGERRDDSLGMRLISSLVEQIDGQLEVTREPFTQFTILFRKD